MRNGKFFCRSSLSYHSEWDLQDECGADAVGGVCVRHDLGDALGCSPAGAVGGYNHCWFDLLEGIDGRRDDRLEEGARQVKSTQNGVDLLYSCLRPCHAENVDDTGMTTAGNYHQPFIAHIDDDGLIVIDPGIGLPFSINFCLLRLHAHLKGGSALNLPRDQQGAVDEKGGAAFDQ